MFSTDERQKAQFLVECQFEPRHVVAAVGVGHEGVGALGGPFDRAAELLRRPQHQDVLGVQKQLHAEPAADVAGHHPDAVFRDMEDALGQQVAQEVRALGRAPQRVGVLAGIVFADGAARLHRIDDDAVVDKLDPDPVARLGHRPLDGGAVAQFPIEAEIAPHLVPHRRLARIERMGGVDGCGQRLVVDRDQLRGIAGRGRRLSATTIATVSPTCRTRSLAIAGRGGVAAGVPSRLVGTLRQGIVPSPSAARSSPV